MSSSGLLLRRYTLLATLVFPPIMSEAKESKPTDERPVLYLKTVTSAGTGLTVVNIDGVRKYHAVKKRLRLEVGQHRIELLTGLLKAINVRGAKGTYQGTVKFSFEAKEGKSYVFAINPNYGGVSADSRVCIYEEPRNTGTRYSEYGDFRNPLPDTEPLQCENPDLRRIEGS